MSAVGEAAPTADTAVAQPAAEEAEVDGPRRTLWQRLSNISETALHDFVDITVYLIIGAILASASRFFLSREQITALASNPVLSISIMMGLAILLCICSEADAFVASALLQFSLTARLAFLVVGPMIDLKLFAMQTGVFGRRFAVRFAPATFVVAVLAAVAVGAVLL